MMLFSRRHGQKPMFKDIQRESIDVELRNGLWNCVFECYLRNYDPPPRSGSDIRGSNLEHLILVLWHEFFKLPLDHAPLAGIYTAIEFIRDRFYAFKWYEVYDLVEFVVANGPSLFSDNFRVMVNSVLERDNSAYRLVGDTIVEITSTEEIESIETAMVDRLPTRGIGAHLQQAAQHLADRKNPDYRNSIKESISAVETLCRHITGEPKATLGGAIKKLEPTIALHPALLEAFSKLYGYTSDQGGIRHSMMDEASPSFSDAKFMLVTCSAFINFVLGKCAENNITI